MVEVDKTPKEREASIGDAGCVKRRRIATNLRPSPPHSDVLFSLLFFCVLFSFLFCFICCPLLSDQLQTKREEEQRGVERKDGSTRMSRRKRNVRMQVGTRRNEIMRVFKKKKRESCDEGRKRWRT